MKRFTIILCLAVVSCKGEHPIPPPGAATVESPRVEANDEEHDNLLNLAHGASVVSRTGEWTLDTSVLSAIDGDSQSSWVTPPGDPVQSAVFSLPGLSQIKRIGFRCQRKPFGIGSIRFEGSSDGRTFTPIVTMTGNGTDKSQLVAVDTAPVRYLRASILSGSEAKRETYVFSFLAFGSVVEAAPARLPAGSWKVNGTNTAFDSQGNHSFGEMVNPKGTTLFDGGGDAHITRLIWHRGPTFGYTALAVSGDGDTLSAQIWNEEPIPLFLGQPWFGQSTHETTRPVASDEVAKFFLSRIRRLPLYSLKFNNQGILDESASADGIAQLGRLIPTLKDARLVAHEFRRGTRQGDIAYSAKTIEQLRASLTKAGLDLRGVTFRPMGSDQPRQVPSSDLTRAMFSVIELEYGQP